MRPTGFERAFDSVADAVELAAALPDEPAVTPETEPVTTSSPADEVQVTVRDGRVQSMRLEQFWVDGASADEVSILVTQVVNKGLDEWSTAWMSQIEDANPALARLNAAVSAGRQQLEDAWNAVLEETRTP